MRLIFLTALLAASCTRVEGDLLVGVDPASLADVRDGSSITFVADTSTFEQTSERLDTLIIRVADNRSKRLFIYYYSPGEFTESVPFPSQVDVADGKSTLRVEVREAEGSFEDLGGGPRDVCIDMRFTDGVRVANSKVICIKG